MDIWNVKDLPPPPVSSCKVTSKEIDIRLLYLALKDGVDFFENQPHLYTEAALLSRSIYRLKMKFRSAKDFKAVEKLGRVMRAYLQIQISKSLKTLLDSIPQNYKLNNTYMLTKNMIDYVLVRIQGLGKTLCRTLETCKVISALMQQRLKLGHFWKIVIVIYAITSRIFVITKNILKYVCKLYTDLLPFSSSLHNSGVQWLPNDYIFPDRLDEWLGVDWLHLEKTVIEIIDDEPDFSYLKLIDDSDDDVEFCDEYILVNDGPSICEPIHLNHNTGESVFDEDNIHKIIDSDKEDDTSDVIFVNKVKAQIPPKRKRSQDTNNIQLEKDEIDVGEVISISSLDNVSKSSRKRSKLNKKTKIRNTGVRTSNRSLNHSISNSASPAKKIKKKRKKSHK